MLRGRRGASDPNGIAKPSQTLSQANRVTRNVMRLVTEWLAGRRGRREKRANGLQERELSGGLVSADRSSLVALKVAGGPTARSLGGLRSWCAKGSAVVLGAGYLALGVTHYCFSQTTTLLTACPSAFVPVMVPVRVLPSFERTSLIVATIVPLRFIVISRV
jgi:hypothetical protein